MDKLKEFVANQLAKVVVMNQLESDADEAKRRIEYEIADLERSLANARMARLAALLRAKGADLCKRSEGNDNKKGYWQAGKADAYLWAADHIEELLT